jgi:hypothetical protein
MSADRRDQMSNYFTTLPPGDTLYSFTILTGVVMLWTVVHLTEHSSTGYGYDQRLREVWSSLIGYDVVPSFDLVALGHPHSF